MKVYLPNGKLKRCDKVPSLKRNTHDRVVDRDVVKYNHPPNEDFPPFVCSTVRYWKKMPSSAASVVRQVMVLNSGNENLSKKTSAFFVLKFRVALDLEQWSIRDCNLTMAAPSSSQPDIDSRRVRYTAPIVAQRPESRATSEQQV